MGISDLMLRYKCREYSSKESMPGFAFVSISSHMVKLRQLLSLGNHSGLFQDVIMFYKWESVVFCKK